MADNDVLVWVKLTLENMDESVREVRKDLSTMKDTLVEQHVSLKDHIQRTRLLEDRAEQMEAQLRPLTQRAAVTQGILRGLGVAAGAATSLGGLWHFGKAILSHLGQ